MNELKIRKRIRFLIALVVIGLAMSGVTAFPIATELRMLNGWLQQNHVQGSLGEWINHVSNALQEVGKEYPFLAYGTDWLAFAHLVIAIAFFGPFKDPVRNSWVIDWGLIACVLVIPLALVAGPVREIPFFHRPIDCSFGVVGFVLLFYCRSLILLLNHSSFQNQSHA